MIRIGCDLDGVLLTHTFFFIELYKRLKPDDEFGIITTRINLDSDKLRIDLSKIGIAAKFIVHKPQEYSEIPDGIFKGVICTKMGVDVLFDDFEGGDSKMITDFMVNNENTLAFMTLNYTFVSDN